MYFFKGLYSTLMLFFSSQSNLQPNLPQKLALSNFCPKEFDAEFRTKI